MICCHADLMCRNNRSCLYTNVHCRCSYVWHFSYFMCIFYDWCSCVKSMCKNLSVIICMYVCVFCACMCVFRDVFWLVKLSVLHKLAFYSQSNIQLLLCVSYDDAVTLLAWRACRIQCEVCSYNLPFSAQVFKWHSAKIVCCSVCLGCYC